MQKAEHEQKFGGGGTDYLLIPEREQVEEIQNQLSHTLKIKSRFEVNFSMSQSGLICCFFEKRMYITDRSLNPLLYYESTSYVNACAISDTGKYALCQMANNRENDEDSGATAVFDVEAKKLISKEKICTGWKGVTHIFIDEAGAEIWFYYGDEKVRYSFDLEPDKMDLQEFYKKADISPYTINDRILELISVSNGLTEDFSAAQKEIRELIEIIQKRGEMSPYQLSQTYKKLGDMYAARGDTGDAIKAYEKGLLLNPGLPVKKKIQKLKKG